MNKMKLKLKAVILRTAFVTCNQQNQSTRTI